MRWTCKNIFQGVTKKLKMAVKTFSALDEQPYEVSSKYGERKDFRFTKIKNSINYKFSAKSYYAAVIMFFNMCCSFL